jgi:hypothetical protein
VEPQQVAIPGDQEVRLRADGRCQHEVILGVARDARHRLGQRDERRVGRQQLQEAGNLRWREPRPKARLRQRPLDLSKQLLRENQLEPLILPQIDQLARWRAIRDRG